MQDHAMQHLQPTKHDTWRAAYSVLHSGDVVLFIPVIMINGARNPIFGRSTMKLQ